MTEQQRPIAERILAAIPHLTALYGYPPTVQELCAAVGIRSTGHLSYYINLLEREGLILRTYRASRSLRVVGAEALCPRCAVLEAEVATLRAQLAEREDAYAG